MALTDAAVRQMLVSLEPQIAQWLQKSRLGPWKGVLNALLAAGVILELPQIIHYVWNLFSNRRQKRQEKPLAEKIERMEAALIQTQAQLNALQRSLAPVQKEDPVPVGESARKPGPKPQVIGMPVGLKI